MKQHNPHFLFKFPGQPGLYNFSEIDTDETYDFTEIQKMTLPKNIKIDVTEIKRPGLSRGIGRMTFAAVVAKFR